MMLSLGGMIETAVESTVAAAAVTGGVIYAALAPGSRIFGSALTAPKNPVDGPGEIALTFDDGPNPCWTPQLLDVLARHNVRATFFLVGQYAAAQRPLVRQMHSAGHLIGNHTWTHPNLARTGSRRTREELARTSAELEQITGAPVRYFRPPFGLRRPGTLSIARELGLIPVTWNAIGNDWTQLTAEQIAARCRGSIARNQKRGFATNLVLHDGSNRTPKADRSRTVTAVELLLEQVRNTHRLVKIDAWER